MDNVFMSKLTSHVNLLLHSETKKRVCEIAKQERTTVSDVMRTFIEKGVAEYGR